MPEGKAKAALAPIRRLPSARRHEGAGARQTLFSLDRAIAQPLAALPLTDAAYPLRVRPVSLLARQKRNGGCILHGQCPLGEQESPVAAGGWPAFLRAVDHRPHGSAGSPTGPMRASAPTGAHSLPLVAAAQQIIRGDAIIIRQCAQCQRGNVDLPRLYPAVVHFRNVQKCRQLSLFQLFSFRSSRRRPPKTCSVSTKLLLDTEYLVFCNKVIFRTLNILFLRGDFRGFHL